MAGKAVTKANLGLLTVEVFRGQSRRYRDRVTAVTLRCESVACHGPTVLLVSAVGHESAVKCLRANLQDDQGRANFSVRFDAEGDGGRAIDAHRLRPHPDGYRVHLHRLGYGLWHVVCIAREPGLMPVLTDDALWAKLQDGERWTTPLLREWLPWLRGKMAESGMLAPVQQVNCAAGLLTGDDARLDALVSEGLKSGELSVPGDARRLRRVEMPADLDGYMLRYGAELGKRAERSMDPLHVPGRDPLPGTGCFAVEPFEAQKHVIAATVKALRRQKSAMIVAEMGSGKTKLSMCSAHLHAAGKPYRALVFCPGQLVEKWEREIRETIPGAEVVQLRNWRDVVAIDGRRGPAGAEWYVIARDRAKLGAAWRPAFAWRNFRFRDAGGEAVQERRVACPHCGGAVMDDAANFVTPGTLARKRSFCRHVRGEGGAARAGCGGALWQMTREVWRYEPALYIKRKLRGYFDYLVLDEFHQEKAADSAQANAAGALAAACRKTIALSGTLIGGYAIHVQSLLFRLAPRSLVGEGLTWEGSMAFSERYGRIDTTIVEKSGGKGGLDDDNAQSRGSKNGRSVRRSVRPGIMPALFGRHLVDNAVFLSLAEVADNLPPFGEEVIPVAMDGEAAAAYAEVEKALRDELKEMLRRGDRRLLGKMLQTLLCYPDHPFGWDAVGYQDGEYYKEVAWPRNLDPDAVRPKEQALIDLARNEKAAGRQLWVFVQYTGVRDVQGRLERMLKGAGLRVGSLRSSVDLAEREAWIAKNAPGLDVVISHPKLVETGLDLFDKGGRHNFPALCFFETGYDTFVMRQASRRSWRIGQTQPCKVYYLFYEETMQARALALMGRKLAAAQALEGKFSTEGLVAMGGEEGNMETALARSLVERMDAGDVRRVWAKVGGGPAPAPGPGRDDDPGGTPAPDPAAAPAGAPARDRAPRLVQPSLPWGGPDLVAAMRRGKVLVADLAAELGVPARKVTAARKGGVAAADRAGWEAAVRAVASRRGGAAKPAAKKPRPRRAAAKSSERGRAK